MCVVSRIKICRFFFKVGRRVHPYFQCPIHSLEEKGCSSVGSLGDSVLSKKRQYRLNFN